MTRSVGTNFLLTIAGQALPLAVSIAVVPLYLAEIGVARYGVLSVVWVLLGLAGFLDFGLARACTNALSRMAGDDADERGAVLITTLWLCLLFGLVGAAALFGAGRWLLGHASSLTPALATELRAALPWAALLLPATLVAEAGGAALLSREQFATLGLLETVSGVAGRVLPIAGAFLISPSLAVLVPAALLTQVGATALVWVAVARVEAGWRLRQFDRGRIRTLLGYGVWVSLTGAVAPVFESLDQLLVGWLLGPVAVAHYAVPMSVASRSTVLCAALAKTLFPRLSRLSPPEARRLAGQATAAIALAFAGVCAPALIMAGPALRLWLGEAFADAARPVAQTLLLGAWAGGVALTPAALLHAQGRPDLVAKLHAAEVAPFVGALWLLISAYGLAGAAWAWTARATADLLAVSWFAEVPAAYAIQSAPALAIMAASWLFAASVPVSVAGSVAAATIAACAAGAGLAASPECRATIAKLTPRLAWVER